MGTGNHAARVARVAPGQSAAVIGDGAVGLCGVLAAMRLGAERIVLMGHHPDRIALAREFGATDIVAETQALANRFSNALEAVNSSVSHERWHAAALKCRSPNGLQPTASSGHITVRALSLQANVEPARPA